MKVCVRLAVFGTVAMLAGALGTAARAQEAPAGKICYARQERGGYYLHVMDADGKNDLALPGQPGPVNLLPSWSPDGKQIAFMSGASAEGMEFGVYVCAADGSGPLRLLANEKLAGLPAWSPDGKTLLAAVGRPHLPQLLRVNVDGTGSQEIPLGLAVAVAAGYAPDGKQIVFTGSDNLQDPKATALYVANPDGTDARKAVSIGGLALGGAGAWSPDGKRIAFTTANPDAPAQDAQVRVWSVAEKSEKPVLELKRAGARGHFPNITLACWSPDSQWLAVSHSPDGGPPGIWRISADGARKERITSVDAACYCPAWTQ